MRFRICVLRNVVLKGWAGNRKATVAEDILKWAAGWRQSLDPVSLKFRPRSTQASVPSLAIHSLIFTAHFQFVWWTSVWCCLGGHLQTIRFKQVSQGYDFIVCFFFLSWIHIHMLARVRVCMHVCWLMCTFVHVTAQGGCRGQSPPLSPYSLKQGLSQARSLPIWLVLLSSLL